MMVDDASNYYWYGEMKVHKGILLGFLVGLILISLGFFLLQEKDPLLVMIKEFALWGGFAVVLGTCIVDVFMRWREFSGVFRERYKPVRRGT